MCTAEGWEKREEKMDSGRSSPDVSDRPEILVVVDVQNDYCHEEGAFGRAGFRMELIQEAVRRLEAFLEAWRALHRPIVFVRTEHSSWTDAAGWRARLRGLRAEVVPEICRAGTWGAAFYQVTPRAGEYVVTKHRFSAFSGTELDLVLRSREVRGLAVAGVTTDVCVEGTVRSAVDLGYTVTVVGDCCGAFEEQDHEAALARMGKYFGTVRTSRDLLNGLAECAGRAWTGGSSS